MTAKTTDFSGLLYYNPAAHGFNPVVSATVFSASSPVNEGNDAYVEVITWNIADGTEMTWRVANMVNITSNRFSSMIGTVVINNNRGAFTINVPADNTTATGVQTYEVLISKTQASPTLATTTITVNDNSQDLQLLVMDLDPKNYVPASSSTITVTTTFSSDYAGGFPPPNTGGSFVRYNGDIATQPSVGDTFDWNGTTRTIAQVQGFETYGASYQYYFIGFYPSVGQGEIGIGQSIDITHGSDGLTITDASGQSHPGVIYGDPGIAHQGADNASFDFSNGSSYIEVPTLQNSAYKYVTTSIWVKPNIVGVSGGSLITKEIAYKSRLNPVPGGTNLNVLAGWEGGAGWTINNSNSTLITNGVWHHIAVSYGATGVALYLDGQLLSTAMSVGPLPINTQRLLIGSYGDGTSEFFVGDLGPARLYNYALTSQQVLDYYNATKDRYLPANGLGVNWLGTTSTVTPTGSFTSPSTGVVVLAANAFVDTGHQLPTNNIFSITIDADLSTGGGGFWNTIWGNDNYSSSGAADYGWVAYLSDVDHLRFGSFNGAISTIGLPPGGVTGRNVWTFVVAGLNVAFYLNGQQITSTTLQGSAPAMANNTLYIGSRHDNSGGAGPNDARGGTYYSVRVRDTVMTSQQAYDEYTAIFATW